MTSYIMLANFTEKGMHNVGDTVKRAEAVKELAKSFGATVKDIVWTLGRFDLVVTLEAPDDMAVTAFGLAVGKAGNVRTQTMRAFSAAEMSKLLGKIA